MPESEKVEEVTYSICERVENPEVPWRYPESEVEAHSSWLQEPIPPWNHSVSAINCEFRVHFF